MVVTKSKKIAIKNGTKYDEKSSLLLGKKALESRMQARARKDKRYKKRVNTAIILCAPLFAGWMVAQVSDKVADAVNENTTLEVTLGIYGLVAVAGFVGDYNGATLFKKRSCGGFCGGNIKIVEK